MAPAFARKLRRYGNDTIQVRGDGDEEVKKSRTREDRTGRVQTMFYLYTERGTLGSRAQNSCSTTKTEAARTSDFVLSCLPFPANFDRE